MDVKKIIALHNELSERIKQFEAGLDTYPPVEVANELRYALRAVVDILDIQTNGSGANLDEALEHAHHALNCAYHDLVDGLAIHISIQLEKLQAEFLEETIQVETSTEST